MDTTANMLTILVFLAAFYTVLGLLCGIFENARELLARPHQRRRMRRSSRRRTPKRGLAALEGGTRTLQPFAATVREKTA